MGKLRLSKADIYYFVIMQSALRVQ